jgi:FkbM family methyltransferase
MTFFQYLLNNTPRFKGKLRLAKLLIRDKSRARTFSTKSGLVISTPNLSENVSLEIFVYGIYEKETIDYMVQSIPKNGTFIDVGANIGAICLEVANKRKDVKVYAFEASPNVFKFLEINKNQNELENLTIYNLAVHENENSEMEFYSPYDQNGKGSFSAVFTSASEKVITKNLDIFIEENQLKPDLIKVDVEGYEMTVFKSMSKFLSKNENCEIFFEFVDWAETAAHYVCGSAQDYLLKKGYRLYKFPEIEKVFQVQLKGSNNLIAKKEL